MVVVGADMEVEMVVVMLAVVDDMELEDVIDDL